MNLEFSLPFTTEELAAAQDAIAKGNALPLRSLCRKEVARFELAVRQHPDYRDGLVMIERRAVEGYLYQKLRNHIDSSETTEHATPSSPYGNEEGTNG